MSSTYYEYNNNKVKYIIEIKQIDRNIKLLRLCDEYYNHIDIPKQVTLSYQSDLSNVIAIDNAFIIVWTESYILKYDDAVILSLTNNRQHDIHGDNIHVLTIKKEENIKQLTENEIKRAEIQKEALQLADEHFEKVYDKYTPVYIVKEGPANERLKELLIQYNSLNINE